MSKSQQFSCYLIGDGSLLLHCAETLLERGHTLFGILSEDEAVKRWAGERGIPVETPGAHMAEFLSRHPFDYLFSIVNKHILRDEVLSLPSKLAVNYHDAPLPKYAGTHATSWALINRERFHGISWHVISAKVDAGDILKARTVEVSERETAFSLNTKCYEAAIKAFGELISDLSGGGPAGGRQNLDERTFYGRFKRPPAAAVLSWEDGAEQMSALARALNFGPHPNPLGAPKLSVRGDFLVATEIDVLDSASGLAPGTVLEITPETIKVATSSRDAAIDKLFTVDGRALTIDEAVNKFGLREGDPLGGLTAEGRRKAEAFNAECCKHERYWVERLAGLRPPEMPYVAREGEPSTGADYASVPVSIPPEARRLFTHVEGVLNPGECLLAAWLAYFSRITNTRIYDVGFREAGAQEELGGVEKLFASHPALRVEVGASQDLPAWSSAFRRSLEEVRKRKTYLRDVVLRYPETRAGLKAGRSYSLPINVEVVDDLSGHTPEGDLTVLIQKDGSRYLLSYDRRALNPAGVERMRGQFGAFLLGLAANPHLPLHAQPVMSAGEFQQVFVEWNDTRSQFSAQACVHELVASQAERSPDAVAVVHGSEALTYRELNERANQLARHLERFGVGPEVLVAICVERSVEMVVGALGILKAGGAYVPLDPAYPAERLAYMLADTRSPLVLTQRSLRERVRGLAPQVICLDSDWDEIGLESADAPGRRVTPGNLAYVIYTSGSTGKPKGVQVEHRSLLNLVFWHQRAFSVLPSDRATQIAGPGFDAAVWELWPYLAAGAAIHIPDDETRMSPSKLVKWFKSEAVTVSFLPTPLAEAVLTEEWPRSVALRAMLTGGDRLNRHPAASLPFQLINNYGPTEGTVVTTSGEVPPGGSDAKPPNIGRPIANMRVHLLDGNLQPVPVGIAGEIHVGGEGLARGYLNLPELTAEKFIPDPFSGDPLSRLYKTGDLARHLPDGSIEFLGRIDHQVKVRGFRIELGEIESVLAQSGGVREAVVLAREDAPGDKRLVAYFVADPDAKVTADRLRNHLKAKLPEYMVPSAFVELEALPLTPNGKIDRRALPAPEPERAEGVADFVPFRDHLERRLTEIWEAVLGISPVGVTDNYFDMGGHSLMAVRMFAEIEKEFGKNLSLSTLFQAPTIEQLANTLRQEDRPGAWSSLVAIQPEGSKRPFFCMHARGGNVLFYRDLARRLGNDRPFYGLQAQGLDGKQPYHKSVEEMAAHYIKEMKSIQPTGPYLLGGSSFGGTAAYEMAQQLVRDGEEVALLALFDTGGPEYPKLLQGTTRAKMKIFSLAQSVGYQWSALRMMDGRERAEFIRGKARKARKRWKRSVRRRMMALGAKLPLRLRNAVMPPYVDKPWALVENEKNISQALKKYVTRPYAGEITLFRASNQPLGIHPDATLGWGEYAVGGLVIHEVPGYHGTIVAEPHVRLLAAKLGECLEKAEGVAEPAAAPRPGAAARAAAPMAAVA